MERIQKVIAQSGYCSRRKAEELIKNGLVTVNGNTVREMGYKVSGNDYIEVEGNSIMEKQDKVYYLLNKPRGIITSTKDDKDRKTVVDLINENKRIYPVGRLDYDTTGLLLLTNDGEFANLMMKPSSEIEKVYLAKINGILTKEDKEKILKGIIIKRKKYTVDKIKVKKIDKTNITSLVEIIIHEGKNHEIRKIFEALNYDTLKLTRVSYGNLNLGNLKSGEYRKLSIKEVKTLYSLAK